MSFEEMYFRKQLEEGKVDPNDAIAYYKERCEALEAQVAELEKQLDTEGESSTNEENGKVTVSTYSLTDEEAINKVLGLLFGAGRKL